MSTGYTTEKSFYVAEGDEGELYIFLKAKNEEPQAPKSFMMAMIMQFSCAIIIKKLF